MTYEPIVWSDALNTGVEIVDEQHRILVNTLNESATILGGSSSVALLEGIIDDLLSYALYHFATEEELMHKNGYADNATEEYDAHIAQHRDFAAQVMVFKDTLKEGRPVSKEVLVQFLQEWLKNHILNTDKKMGRYELDRPHDKYIDIKLN